MIKRDIYESAEMEIVLFDIEDVITTSSEIGDTGETIPPEYNEGTTSEIEASDP
ncbi:MAG: hypothetical protein ACI4RP_06965 [Acutalibacteraceae bacterium]